MDDDRRMQRCTNQNTIMIYDGTIIIYIFIYYFDKCLIINTTQLSLILFCMVNTINIKWNSKFWFYFSVFTNLFYHVMDRINWF